MHLCRAVLARIDGKAHQKSSSLCDGSVSFVTCLEVDTDKIFLHEMLITSFGSRTIVSAASRFKISVHFKASNERSISLTGFVSFWSYSTVASRLYLPALSV